MFIQKDETVIIRMSACVLITHETERDGVRFYDERESWSHWEEEKTCPMDIEVQSFDRVTLSDGKRYIYFDHVDGKAVFHPVAMPVC